MIQQRKKNHKNIFVYTENVLNSLDCCSFEDPLF